MMTQIHLIPSSQHLTVFSISVPKMAQKCPTCPLFVPKLSQKCPKSVPNPAFVVKMPPVFADFSQSSKPIPAIARCSISTSFFDAPPVPLPPPQGLQPGCASVILLRAAAVYDLLPNPVIRMMNSFSHERTSSGVVPQGVDSCSSGCN